MNTLDPLQYDPKAKQNIKQAIYEILYEPVRRQYEARINDIIRRNVSMQKLTHQSFIFRNVIYNCDPTPLPRKMNRLHPQLQPDMGQYLKETKALNEQEIPQVLGYVTQVLNASNSLEDYLRLLPQAVHAPIVQLVQTCPCRNRQLLDETVDMLQTKNQYAIDLMRRRMVANLIL